MPYIKRDSGPVTDKLVYVSGPKGDTGTQGPPGQSVNLTSASITITANGTLGVGALANTDLLYASRVGLTSSGGPFTIYGSLSNTSGLMHPDKEFCNDNGPGGDNIIFASESSSAAAKDRFTLSSSSITLAPGESLKSRYNYSTSRNIQSPKDSTSIAIVAPPSIGLSSSLGSSPRVSKEDHSHKLVIDKALMTDLSSRAGERDGEILNIVHHTNGNGDHLAYKFALGISTGADGATKINSSNGQWQLLYYGDEIKPEWFGAKADWDGTSGTDNTAAIQSAINASALGKKILFGPGIYACSGLLDLAGKSYVRFRGCATLTDQRCEIRYVGAGTSNSFITASNTGGFTTECIVIRAQPLSGSFTGKLVDLDSSGSAAGAVFDKTYFDIVGSTGITLALSNTYNIHVRDCAFNHCDVGIRGPTDGSHFSNGVVVHNTIFVDGGARTAQIQNLGNAWHIGGGTSIGALLNGSANGIHSKDTSAQGCTIQNVWFGDTTGTVAGQWVRGSFFGCSIRDNKFETAGNSNINGVLLDGACNGLKIGQNVFGGMHTAVKYGTGTIMDAVDQLGNVYISCVNIREGSPQTGHCDSGGTGSFSIGCVYEVFQPWHFRAEQVTSGQSIPDNTATLVVLNGDYDPANLFQSNLGNIPVTGYYVITAQVKTVQSTGWMECSINKAGGATFVSTGDRESVSGSASITSSSLYDRVKLNAGDQIGLYVTQATGGAKTIYYARMSVKYDGS